MPTITADGIYYVDLGPDPDFTDGSFISAYPEQATWDDHVGNGDSDGVGNFSCQFTRTARDQDGDLVISAHDFIGPWRSYFRLRYGNDAIMAGPVTNTGIGLNDDFMSVSGKTWEAYMARWQYPFDGRTHPPSDIDHINDFTFSNTFMGNESVGSGVATPNGLAYQANNRDVILIWSDLIANAMNLVPNRMIFDLSKLATLSGIRTNYQLSLNDTSYFDSIIQGLAGTGQGFDWWISWTRKFYWATPYRFGNPATPSLIYTIDSDHLPEDLAFQNEGPMSTHTNGNGAGLATQTTLSRAFGYGPAQTQFTRLDANYDFGDVRNVDQLINKTQRRLSKDLQPVHTIPVTIDPTTFVNFWPSFRKGRAIYIDLDLGYHHIDSGQQIVGYSANMNEEGDVLVDLTLSQIYDLSYNAGSAEG
jgi:hypothetical protein